MSKIVAAEVVLLGSWKGGFMFVGFWFVCHLIYTSGLNEVYLMQILKLSDREREKGLE